MELAKDLREKPTKMTIQGYRLTHDKIIFTSVAGTFNEWNPKNKMYQIVLKGNNKFELDFPNNNLIGIQRIYLNL
ncbi:hypothetical protein CHRY9393_01045 [Chryseobacterium fistulae]|uniref:Uncharacterized protein n=1 Tax=Chryseobacterium fistulae TaxID=2675058 RepID=A0A6N4XQ62_9FLAO|nr:hypothetical protein CHRY9393_01045 [Chryseobacterium fistulae]